MNKSRVHSYNSYGANFKALLKKIEKASNKPWIFYDTETTGLGADKDFHQVVQIAAIVVDIKNFKQEPEIIEKFNIKISLLDKTKDFIQYENRKKKKTQKEEENSRFKTIAECLSMNQYGISRSNKKRRRKAMLNNSLFQKNVKYHKIREAIPLYNNFLDKYKDRVMVAQNAPFDIKFLEAMYSRVSEEYPDDISIDTVQLFNKYLVPALKKLKADKETGIQLSERDENILKHLTIEKTGNLSVSLGKLIDAFDIKNEGWHDALSDVVMLMNTTKAVINYLEGRDDLNSLPPEPERIRKSMKDKPSDIALRHPIV